MRKHGMGACFLHAYNMRDYYVVPNSRGACANLKTRTCARSPDVMLKNTRALHYSSSLNYLI